ncbi:hypothetical protein [Hymenobacter rigui]|uniref:Uncharacterized protein n=1 Tax=Hymenobacter rigui TaxID=334424 RepID=A0A3R9MMN0_9BACT|nr:hypothetical protein [Hymenobacter rigui]RSK44010.1 hypothetical protein EI291_20660 [Hymenobacter rigui]
MQPQEIALPTVQIRAVQTVNLTSINRKTTAANPFYPGTEVAIKFTLPDSTKTYRVRTVTIPVKEPFKEGRIRLNICLRGNSPTLLGTRLLPDTVFSSPLDPAAGRQPVVRFDLSPFALMLPKSEFFLVLDCLSGDAASRVIRQRLESKKGPNKKGVSKGVMYLEVEDKEQNGSRAISVYDYPQLLTTPTEGISATWRRFSPTLPFQQLSPSVSRGNRIRAYNIAAALEVEVW